MLPTTFPRLILPDACIPIMLDGAEICAVDVPESGRVECDVTQELHDRLGRGDAVLQPVTATQMIGGEARFQLLELKIVVII